MTIKELDKSQKDLILPLLFDILYMNMSKIAPTGNVYEEDFAFWLSCVSPALDKKQRHILLIFDKEDIIGYFQYYVNDDCFMMEEIQLKEQYHKTGVFGELYRYLILIIPENTERAEAFANKANKRSIAILEHLGLRIVGENKSGNSYHFSGKYENILKKYRDK